MANATDRRIKRITRRIDRLERRLARVQKLEASGRKGPLMTFVARVAKETNLDIDDDGDGEIELEELVEEVAARLDELVKLDGVAELVTDMGIKALAWAACSLYANRVTILKRRLDRNRRKLRDLGVPHAA